MPIRAGPTVNEVLEFAKAFVARLAAAYPEKLTVEHAVAARRGRVYLDPFRNAFAQTVVSPFGSPCVEGPRVHTARLDRGDYHLDAR